MLLDSEAPAQHWKAIRMFGAVVCVGGFILTALPFIIKGIGAGPLDPFIILGPFFVIMGAVIYLWAKLGTMRTKQQH